jgi:hypothetical protein
MSAYRDHGKTISTKRDSGRKLTLTEIDYHIFRRIVSKNHTITSELDINLEDPVSTKNCPT